MKYKVGDRVVVREDLSGEIWGGVNYLMEAWAGKTVTITQVAPTAYQIEEDDYWWTEECFECLESELKSLTPISSADFENLFL